MFPVATGEDARPNATAAAPSPTAVATAAATPMVTDPLDATFAVNANNDEEGQYLLFPNLICMYLID